MFYQLQFLMSIVSLRFQEKGFFLTAISMLGQAKEPFYIFFFSKLLFRMHVVLILLKVQL